MNLNKNISIWRGDSTPPTNYHFWIKSNGQQFTFNGEKWVNYVEDIPTASLESKGLMSSQDKVNLEECIQHLEDTSNPHSVTKTQVGLGNVTNDVQVKRSEMGVANGVATLDADGKVPTSQLPSYVDDIIDVYATYSKSDTGVLSNVTLYLDAAHTQLVTGEAGKIYQNIADGEPQYQFRWTGTIFSQTGTSSLILGEVTGTAYDGAKGKANADNIAKIKGTSLSHIKDAVPITTAADKVSINYECYEGNQYGAAGTDHTADIPAATTSKAGVMSATDKTNLDSVVDKLKDVTVIVDKVLVTPVITSQWTIKNQAGDTVTLPDINLSSNNIIIETGYKVDYSGSFKWIHSDGKKDPTSVNGSYGTALPASNINSATLTDSNITANKTYTVNLVAPKKGLMLSGSTIVAATGNDTTKATAQVSFQHKRMWGVTTDPVNITFDAFDLANSRAKTITGVTANTTQYYYYAYPKTLGALTKITQNGAAPVIEDFNRVEKTIVNAAGASIAYYIYTTKNKGAFTNVELKFE